MGSSPRRVLAARGAVFALAALLMLVVVRNRLGDAPLGWAWVGSELTSLAVVYVYFSVAMAGLVLWLAVSAGRLLKTTARVRESQGPLVDAAALDAFLAGELARSRRYGTPVSLLLIDFDDLDEWRRLAGTRAHRQALESLADILSRQCRGMDMAARHSGTRFAVVAPCTSADRAVHLAERVRLTLGPVIKRHFPEVAWAPGVSVGVADVERAGRPDRAALFSLADAALYEARARGGRQSVVAQAPRPEPPKPPIEPQFPNPAASPAAPAAAATPPESPPAPEPSEREDRSEIHSVRKKVCPCLHEIRFGEEMHGPQGSFPGAHRVHEDESRARSELLQQREGGAGEVPHGEPARGNHLPRNVVTDEQPHLVIADDGVPEAQDERLYLLICRITLPSWS